MQSTRKDLIAAALTAELERQSGDGRFGLNDFVRDIDLLAGAIDRALGSSGQPEAFNEGKTPDQLDATNDD